MTILQFAQRPFEAPPSVQQTTAAEHLDPDLSTSPCEDSGKVLLDDLGHFLRRNSALTKEVERQIASDMNSLAALFQPSNSLADLQRVEQLAVALERLKGLQRMKCRLDYLGAQQIEETKGRLALLDLEPLDLPMAAVLTSFNTMDGIAAPNARRDFFPAFLGLGEISAESVTYVDLTNIFDNCDDMASIDMS